jgi:UDP-glucose 4-epimerase
MEAVNDSAIVYNFAGLADLDESVNQPKLTIEQNVIGNINILEACKSANIERYIYASSAYALSDRGSFYGISKLTSEKIIEEYQTRLNVPYSIIRYGSLYGERADRHNGMYIILRQALKEGVVKHRGDGEEVREFIHAADAAQLSVDIAESSEFVNQHIVLTGVERLKHKDLHSMIRDILPHPLEIVYSDDQWEGHYQVTPYSFRPNRAKKLVPNPFIDLGQGLTECIEFIYEELQNEKSNSDN